MRVILTIIPLFALAACDAPLSQPAERQALPPVAEDGCRANQNADLIGQDATALERVLLMGQVRVIRPGQAVTADFRPNRINFIIDQANTIVSIACY